MGPPSMRFGRPTNRKVPTVRKKPLIECKSKMTREQWDHCNRLGCLPTFVRSLEVRVNEEFVDLVMITKPFPKPRERLLLSLSHEQAGELARQLGQIRN
jgi:hypothetical protein